MSEEKPKEKKPKDKGFLLRVDPVTMAIIERWAAEEFRSVNGQLQWIINDAIKRYGKKRGEMRDER